jgi:hypothetical protein
MDRDGVEVQIMRHPGVALLSPPGGAGAGGLSRIFNDAARELCARAPRRLKSLRQVPRGPAACLPGN